MKILKTVHSYLSRIPRGLRVVGAIIFVIFYFLFIFGHIAVLFAPEGALLSAPSTVIVNDNNYEISGGRAGVGNAKPLLSGVGLLWFHFDTNLGILSVQVPVNNLTSAQLLGEPIPLVESSFEAKADFFNDGSYSCLTLINDSEINGSVSFDYFKQFFKKIRLKAFVSIDSASFDLKVSCDSEDGFFNREIPIVFNNISGTFELDSSVIYEWSGKGGDTYRL